MTYFRSNTVRIFPCASRGTKDLNAVVASEYNYTHLFGLSNGKSSYIYSVVTEETEEGATYTYAKEVVVNGYYFQFFPTAKDTTKEEKATAKKEKDALTLDTGRTLFIALTSEEEKSLLCSCLDGAASLDNNDKCYAVCSGETNDTLTIDGTVVIELPLKSEYMVTAKGEVKAGEEKFVTGDTAYKAIEDAKSAAAKDATSKANIAESNAKTHADTKVGDERTRAEGQEAAIRSDFVAADTETLISAKAYTNAEVEKIIGNGGTENPPNINELQGTINELQKVVFAGETEGSVGKPAIGSVMHDIDGLQREFEEGGRVTALETLADNGNGEVKAGANKLVTGGAVHTAIDNAKKAIIGDTADDLDNGKYTIHSVKNYTDSLIGDLRDLEDYTEGNTVVSYLTDKITDLTGKITELTNRITELENAGMKESS